MHWQKLSPIFIGAMRRKYPRRRKADREGRYVYMKRDGWKWALAGGAIALLIVYGLDSADNGIRNVYGPVGANVQPPAVNSISQVPPETTVEVERSTLTREQYDNSSTALDSETYRNTYAGNERLPGVPYDSSEPTVNKQRVSCSPYQVTASNCSFRCSTV
jgi:hypothetical protein